MGRREKDAYLAKIRDRYRKASREQKSKILDEFCAVCDYQRKYAIRLLSQQHAARPPARLVGRKARYNHPGLIRVIRRIWLATDQMCGKRLKAALPLWMPHDEAEHTPYDREVSALLALISPATLDRLLRDLRADAPCKELTGTKPGTLLKNKIPIRTSNWDITLPGYLEADTVAHCGNSLAGDFVWSLTVTDILTRWTECRATWNKGTKGVVKQIQSVYERALTCESIDMVQKQRLRGLAFSLNPFELKRRIEEKLKAIFQLVPVTSNVRHRI
ncbi:hypothetical protein [Desulfurivibrio sp. C05AmB]|uniref:hypothetical protein n=1 Tax=Desulfurivibrio sp. C05AmB TaxID=3374371 RepID=UPI00376F3C7C